MTSILSITTKIEQKLKKVLSIATNINVYLNSQNYSTYPCYIIRIKESKVIPTLPTSYEIDFEIILLDYNEFDLTTLLEKALLTITQENLQFDSKISSIAANPNIPTTLEIFNLECKCVKWSQGQDLISSGVTIYYTCSVIHKITEEELLAVNQLQLSLT